MMRRVRVVSVSSDLLEMVWRPHDWLKLESDWPSDARLVGASWATKLGVLELLIESESFDPVEEGSIPPQWEPTFRQTLLDPVLAKMFHAAAGD